MTHRADQPHRAAAPPRRRQPAEHAARLGDLQLLPRPGVRLPQHLAAAASRASSCTRRSGFVVAADDGARARSPGRSSCRSRDQRTLMDVVAPTAQRGAPAGLGFMEWSNALAERRREQLGRARARARFAPPTRTAPSVTQTVELRVRPLFARSAATQRPDGAHRRGHRAPGRADAEPVLAVAERLPRVRLLLLGGQPARTTSTSSRRSEGTSRQQLAERAPLLPRSYDVDDAHPRGALPRLAGAAALHRRRPVSRRRLTCSRCRRRCRADAHLVDSGDRRHLLVPNGNRLYDVEARVYERLDRGPARRPRRRARRAAAGARRRRAAYVDDSPPDAAAGPRAVARGRAEVQPRLHVLLRRGRQLRRPPPPACRSTRRSRRVDLLFGDVAPGERVNLAFLGGEPLLNRSVIRAATRRACDDRRRARRPRDVLDHDQRHAADRRRRRLLRGARLRGHGQPRRRRRRARPPAAAAQRARQLSTASSSACCRCSQRQRRMQVSARVTVTPRQPRARARRSTRSSRSASTAWASRRCCARRPGRGELGAAELAAMLDRDGPLRRGVRAPRRRRRALSVRQRRQRDARDPPRHAPAVPVRCGRRLPRRVGERRAGRLPSLRRRRGGRARRRARRRRPRPSGRLAARAPRPSPGAVSQLLGALPVRRRLPSRGHRPRPPGVRLHPRLAALVDRRVRAARAGPPGLLRGA